MKYEELNEVEQQVCLELGYSGLFAGHKNIHEGFNQCKKILQAEGCPENISIMAMQILINSILPDCVRQLIIMRNKNVIKLIYGVNDFINQIEQEDLLPNNTFLLGKIKKLYEIANNTMIDNTKA